MQSDVLRIFVLGDFVISQSFLHRIIFGDALYNSSTLSKTFDENRELPHSKYACSYLLDNQRCYTLQFWEIGDMKGLERAENSSYPTPDLVLVVVDVCASRNSLKTKSLLSEVKNKMPNAPQLIIAAKVVFTRETTEIDNNDQVTIAEIRETASAYGALCVECSPDTGDGIQNATALIVHMAVHGQKPNKRGRCPFRRKQRMKPIHFFPETLVFDPSGIYGMENAPKCPGVNVLASSCEADLARMRTDTSCLDVRFTFQDSSHTPPIEAHQVILISSAPQLFKKIFTGQTKSEISGRQNELFAKVSWPTAPAEPDSSNNNAKRMVEVRVSDKVPRQECLKLLDFLYMGASIADLQRTDFIYELLAIAKTFNLTQLLEACENVLEGNEMQNSVKSSFVGGGRATVLRDMFFDKPLLDDLVFQIQGSLIYAHQVVVIARCRVLAERIAEFKRIHPDSIRVKIEIDEITVETFKSLLEYLYTDDVKRDLQHDTLLELLELASTYQLLRLVTLCEYLIIVNLNEDCSCERINQIFLVAKNYNANQLSKWCLTLFARNYHQFSACNHNNLLNNEEMDYVEQHQWPPRCVLSTEYSQALHEFIAIRKEDQDSNNCCVLS